MARRKQTNQSSKIEQVEVSQTEQVEQVESNSKSFLNRHNGKLQLSDGTVVDAGKSVNLTSNQLEMKDVQRLIEMNFLVVS